VDIARQHLLAGAGFAGDEDGGVASRHLIGQRDDRAHGFVFVDELMALVRHRRQHGRDQLGIGRQRQILLGSGANGVDGAARVGADAAGHHRRADALGGERADQPADVVGDIAHDEIGAAPGAQFRQSLVDVARVRDLGAAIHRDLGRRADLALQRADNE
jgi:hypothetical protein